ncbi:MAG: ParB/RepB/Spo0J family partition protein [Limnochordaceae bacterium]|nr:ParB/RepB/Spo0J family partition protein [Limnochordaceae bacterium]
MAEYRLVPIDRIVVDPNQVRRTFRDDALDGLAQSLREVGMLHPVLVTPLEGGSYRLISGERRLRAAKRAGEHTVPALVLRDLRGTAHQIQLIENLQREDLNPMERALAIHSFMEQEHLSKAAAAARLGVPRTTLTDWLDVLDLDERHQAALVDNFAGGDSPLTLSHVAEAKALAARLGSPGIATVLLDAVLEYRLSKAETRQVAQLVRNGPNVNIQQAVRMVRGHASSDRRHKMLAEPLMASVGDGAAAAADGQPAGRNAPGGAEEGAGAGEVPAGFSKLFAALDRFRRVLAALAGGALVSITPQQRRDLVAYLETLSRWIAEVIAFAREVDDPSLAARRREAMRRAAKELARRARRKKHKHGTHPPAMLQDGRQVSSGWPLTPPGAGAN